MNIYEIGVLGGWFAGTIIGLFIIRYLVKIGEVNDYNKGDAIACAFVWPMLLIILVVFGILAGIIYTINYLAELITT